MKRSANKEIPLPDVMSGIPSGMVMMVDFAIRKLGRQLISHGDMPQEAKPIITNLCTQMLDELIPLPNAAMKNLPHVRQLMRESGEGRNL